MHFRLLVPVLFLFANSSVAFVIINAQDFSNTSRYVPVNPRDIFDIEGFLGGHGYSFEQHKVTTEDGYVLGIHRIPSGREGTYGANNDKTKPAVLMMSGMFSTSVEYFIFGPDKSLAMMLADLGYDVWMGNNRGNTWSRKHISKDPDVDPTFWDFSFHDLGAYDIPATIDYILNITGNEKVNYIGHSQGCTQFFVTTSMKPEYNEKINLMVALAPPVFLQHMTNPIILTLTIFYDVIENVMTSLNVTEVLPFTTMSAALQALCSPDSGFQDLCVTVLFMTFGFDNDQLNRETFPIIFQDLPAGGSAKEILHYFQLVKSGHFRQYDYGKEKNTQVYNGNEPPDYNLAAVTAPIALYYGQNDWLVGLTDIDRLAQSLPNVVENHLVGYERFNHIDFVFANDVAYYLYYDVINLINSHNGFDPITSTSPAFSTKSTTTRTTTTTTTTIKPSTDPQTTGNDNSTTSAPPTTPSSASKMCHFILMHYGLFSLIVIYLLN